MCAALREAELGDTRFDKIFAIHGRQVVGHALEDHGFAVDSALVEELTAATAVAVVTRTR